MTLYTTLTVEAYNKLEATITRLRWQMQKARECLEAKDSKKALQILSHE